MVEEKTFVVSTPDPMFLSKEQLDKVLASHVEKVINGMDEEALREWAIITLQDHFYRLEYDGLEEVLMNDVLNHEGGDEGEAIKFLTECGVSQEVAEQCLN
jgi:hypothetical protein